MISLRASARVVSRAPSLSWIGTLGLGIQGMRTKRIAA
jgi:hypothetical protein